MSKSGVGARQFAVAQLLTHLRIPLYRNAYALILSEATSSGLGIVYWILAARYYPPAVVGLNAAAISTMMFLSTIAQLNMRGAMIRFIPCAGRATKRAISVAYCLSVLVAALVGLIFVLGHDLWMAADSFLGGSSFFTIWFVIATMAWCIFAIQDSVLIGLRQATWVPIENTIFGVAKIALLLAFAHWMPQYGIFASWAVLLPLLILPVNLLIFRRLVPRHVAATGQQAAPIIPAQVARFVAGDYLGAMLAELSTRLLPIMVIGLIGAGANAYFYQPWTIAFALQLILMNMAASLTVEGATEQHKLGLYSRRILVQMVRLIVPLVVLLLVGAPYLLQVYGADYAAEGANLLRLLALAALPSIVTTLYIGVARVKGQIRRVIMVQAAICVLVLGLSYLLLQWYGITGIGWAWLISQGIVAGVLAITQLRPMLRSHG